MDTFQNTDNTISRLFRTNLAIIGDIHCPPFPGTPRYRKESPDEIADRVLLDARAYEQGGVDGVIVENHGDIPFLPPGDLGLEIIASMAVVARQVRQELRIAVGINLLANNAIGAFAIAKAVGADFIRVNQWVNAYVSNEGFLEGRSAHALRYRKMIDAENVAVFADVHVKHGSHAIVDDRPVSEQAGDVEFADADVAIATGNRTGDEVPETEISAIRSGTSLPIIAGSGVSINNVTRLLPLLSGAIVGSSLKRDGVWHNEVEIERVKRFMELVHSIR